jgi:pyruvate dehydrogenase E2 component (dihydrolipoamide acetyltransferase)
VDGLNARTREDHNMSQAIDIKVPDIGDFTDVPVIEIFVSVGDTVTAEDPLISLESDKATMDVPSPQGGVVKAITVKVGDKLSEGSVFMQFEGDGAAVAALAEPAAAAKPSVSAPPSPVSAPAGLAEVRVPDIGDFKDVPVIEIFVKVGDTVKAEDALVSLESDKATMDVPAPLPGVVKEIRVKVGDKVSEGSVIIALATGDASAAASTAPAAVPPAASAASAQAGPAATTSGIDEAAFALAYAGPAVRKLARELGVDLGQVKGSAAHGRIVRADVEAFAKGGAASPKAAPGKPAAAPSAGGAGLDLLPWPKVDFAKFGPIERKELSRIKKISAANLHRNWVVIPHVTTHDEADITDLEQFRVQMNKELEKSGVKVSMLPFMMKAAVATLKKFPDFNASLEGDALVLKNYWHIGFAADTPNGLMVPVIRDCDKKTIPEITKEMGDLAKLARDGKLKPDQMQGGTFTISSLGGIGGIYFTPIINAPEVAIMGVCKSYWKQHSSDGKTSAWRLTLPLSLSWDHRVIDGAAAARFNVHFANLLADMRRIMF